MEENLAADLLGERLAALARGQQFLDRIELQLQAIGRRFASGDLEDVRPDNPVLQAQRLEQLDQGLAQRPVFQLEQALGARHVPRGCEGRPVDDDRRLGCLFQCGQDFLDRSRDEEVERHRRLELRPRLIEPARQARRGLFGFARLHARRAQSAGQPQPAEKRGAVDDALIRSVRPRATR